MNDDEFNVQTLTDREKIEASNLAAIFSLAADSKHNFVILNAIVKLIFDMGVSVGNIENYVKLVIQNLELNLPLAIAHHQEEWQSKVEE